MRIALLAGGRSTEHDASLRSYAHVARCVLSTPSEITLDSVVYVDRIGNLHLHSRSPWPTDASELADPAPISAADALDRLAGTFCFSLLHGNEGEDGAWQGVAEVFGLSGSFGPVLPAALAMNKRMQSLVVQQLAPELAVPQTWTVRAGTELAQLIGELGGRPIVLKPNRMGASLLTQRLMSYDAPSLAEAVGEIFRYDDTALVQEYISGEEFSCGVIEQDGRARALPAMRIDTASGFFGHREKHRRGQARSEVASPSDAVTEIRRVSEQLFEELGLLGWARFDYIVAPTATCFLEINSLPGLMNGSLFPRMLHEAGLTIVDLIKLTAEAARRRTAREKFLVYDIEH